MKISLNEKSVVLDSEIVSLLMEIEEFKGSWKAYGNLAPQRLTELQRIATIESIGSSTRIEGSQLSDAEVSRLMAGLSTTSFSTGDEQEVAGYAFLMNEIFESWEEMPLTENVIKQMHSILMRVSTKDERHRGAYKTVENNVAAFFLETESRSASFLRRRRLSKHRVAWKSSLSGQTCVWPRRNCLRSSSSACSSSLFWQFVRFRTVTGGSPVR